MADDELTVTAILRDEISAPAKAAAQSVDNITKSVNKANEAQAASAAKATKATKEIGDAQTETASKTTTALKSTAGAVSVLTQQYRSFSTTVSNASSSADQFIGRVGTRTAQAATLGFGALAAYGLKASSSIEMMQTSLNTMLGPDQGGKLFTNLQNLANITPFTTQQQVQAGQILSAYGFTTDQTEKLSASISDIAAASSDPVQALQGISVALGQVQAKGHVAGQELNQLVNYGVPGIKQLADIYGTSTDKVQKFMDAGGQVPAQAFIDSIINETGEMKKYSGVAVAQSKTLFGTWSTFTSNVQQDAAKSFKGVSDVIKGSLGSPQTLGAVDQFFNQLTPGFATIASSAIKAEPSFLKIFGALGGAALKGLGSIFQAAQPALTKLADDSPKFADGISKASKQVAPLVPDLIKLTDNMLTLGITVLPTVIHQIDNIVGPIANLTSQSRLARDAVGGLLIGFLGWKFVSPIVTGINSVANALGGLAAKEALANDALLASGAAGKGPLPLSNLALLGGLAGAGLGASYVAGNAKSAQGQIAGYAGTGAIAGASFGLLGGPFAEISVPVGAAVGGLTGAAYGALKHFGDVQGNYSSTLGSHSSVESMTPGSRSITSGVRNWGLASSSSGHLNGTAVDVNGPWMATYARNVQAAGGWAKQHDAGSGMHVHAQYGDADMPAMSSLGGSSAGGASIVMFNTINTPLDLESAVNRAIDKRDRRTSTRTQ